MLNTRNLLALLTVATAGLAACEPLFVDFDGYREYPPDSGAGSGNGGNAGSGNGGNAGSGNGGSTNGGSAAGGSGNSGGDGGSAAGGSGNAGSGNAAGDGGSGNAAGNGGSAGSGGDGCAPEDPEPVCGPNMNCEFKSLIPPYDYSTECIPAGTGIGAITCSNSDSTQCAPPRVCFNGSDCLRWCRLGTQDCTQCGASCEQSVNPVPTIGNVRYGLCSSHTC